MIFLKKILEKKKKKLKSWGYNPTSFPRVLPCYRTYKSSLLICVVLCLLFFRSGRNHPTCFTRVNQTVGITDDNFYCIYVIEKRRKKARHDTDNVLLDTLLCDSGGFITNTEIVLFTSTGKVLVTITRCVYSTVNLNIFFFLQKRRRNRDRAVQRPLDMFNISHRARVYEIVK